MLVDLVPFVMGGLAVLCLYRAFTLACKENS